MSRPFYSEQDAVLVAQGLLATASQSLHNEFAKKFNLEPYKSVPYVHQYTNCRSAEAILHARAPFSELWATAYTHLNDIEEFRIGKDLFNSALNHLEEDRASSASFTGEKFLPLLKSALEKSSDAPLFCASFSAKEDDLNQWRAYGEDGKGICLSFNASALHSPSIEGIFTPVIYLDPGDELAIQAMSDFLESVILQALEFVDVRYPLDNSPLDQILVPLVGLVCLSIKHRAFVEESEFRLIISEPKENQIDYRGFPVTPFYKIVGTPNLPLREIKLGPMNNSDRTAKSLREFLVFRGFENVLVSKSTLPYLSQR